MVVIVLILHIRGIQNMVRRRQKVGNITCRGPHKMQVYIEILHYLISDRTTVLVTNTHLWKPSLNIYQFWLSMASEYSFLFQKDFKMLLTFSTTKCEREFSAFTKYVSRLIMQSELPVSLSKISPRIQNSYQVKQMCGPMLVPEPNVVWLLVTVLVVAVVFVTTTFASDCLLLSSPSVPTLCLKDPRREVDEIQPDLLLMVR